MIIFDNVSKVYPNKVKGLDGVSLTIAQGEFVAIIGRSGAGKSTLLRAVNKMHEVTAGTLKVDDVEVRLLEGNLGDQHISDHRGPVNQIKGLEHHPDPPPESPQSLPEMPLFRVLLGLYRKEDKIAALTALDKVGILEKAYVRVDQISGGQQQRVALARTLAQNPQIILADEPVAALDPVTARQVMDDFKRINQETNITILLNIHHVELALEYADRIIGIRSGRIVFDGKAAEVDRTVIERIYTEEPVYPMTEVYAAEVTG